jgi:lysylphosphatidylglycerol synthetase-like protein (DUF2156 family)
MTRLSQVVEHGKDAIAWSTLQPGLQYFDTDEGFLAYHHAWGIDLTLGPPVCAPAHGPELTARFAREHRPTFFYVSESDARALASRHGLFCAGIGVEKILPLGRGPLDGDKRVRSAVKKAAAAGFGIERARVADCREQISAINAAYLSSRALPYEMRFLNRPMDLHDDGLARVYLLRWHGAVRGYARLNPYFEGGKPVGWLLDVIRFGRTRLWGVFYAAVVALAEELEREGARELSLGYCPLHAAKTADDLPRSRALDAQIAWLSRHLAGVPYVARLAEQKDAFPGEERQRYLVTGSRSVARPMLALFEACGVRLRSLVGTQLLQSLAAPLLERAGA